MDDLDQQDRLLEVAGRLGKFKEAINSTTLRVAQTAEVVVVCHHFEAVSEIIIGPIFEDRFFDEFSASKILERMGAHHGLGDIRIGVDGIPI